jgi:mannose/fructose-specific phosphotransferase system component IIA
MHRFRIVIAAHGGLAAAFRESAEMICGPTERIVALGLDPEDSPESFADRLRSELDAVTGPVLILTDLPGGTPHNVANVVARGRPKTAVLSGVNLGIVIEAVTSTESLDDEAVARLVSAGRDSIVDATTRLVRDVT